MSSIPAIKCDRCDARALLDDEGFRPSGWGSARISSPKPYYDTGAIDLCPDCIKVVYEMTRSRSIPKGKS